MKIGLIDLDKSHFPNLPLMKLSAWHKSQGDDVGWYDHDSTLRYDKVYVAKVFDWTNDIDYTPNADAMVRGGIGWGLKNDNPLPDYVEHCYPDYSIYGTETAYGFLTRGCPRNCAFCNVSQHQGLQSRKVADLSEFWKDQKEIVLLDPNILACRDWKPLLQQLIDSKAYVDFSQGLDVRMMTMEKAEMIKKLKLKRIHFAWDKYELSTYNKLKEYRSILGMHRNYLTVYVLINFNTTFEQDLDRVYKLRELDYLPYVMIYDKKNAKTKHRELARWVNARPAWRTCDNFEEYLLYMDGLRKSPRGISGVLEGYINEDNIK